MSKSELTGSADRYPPRNQVVSMFDDGSWGQSFTNINSKQRVSNQQESIASDIPDPFRFDFFAQLFSLLYFKSSLYASVLEDTITELRILDECNNELRITKTMSDMGMHLANKYSIAQPAFKDELDGINPKDLGNEKYKLNKLASDRKYLYETLLATYLDLSLDRTFKALHECVLAALNRDSHIAFLLEDEARNRISSRELARQLRQQRNHIKSVTYDTDVTIETLKSKVEDAALEAEIRSRYVTNWQVARSEQHVHGIKLKEAGPLSTIEYYKAYTEGEQRVHSEVELLVNITINEKLEMVESWMEKYDKDMENMDLKIQIKKNEHTDAYEKRIDLEKTFEKHDQLMKDWIHFKDEREKARLYREKMTNSAIVVQSWWRGLLVRMQLGPYRPVKKPKGGKKK